VDAVEFVRIGGHKGGTSRTGVSSAFLAKQTTLTEIYMATSIT
jgi:hypothetical protein